MAGLIRYIFQLLIWIVIFFGLIVAGLRIGLANLDVFRSDIETWVSEELSPGIKFGGIRSYWKQINPVLELENASITLPDRTKSLVVDSISIELDLWDSLVLGSAVISEVTGVIDQLSIRKDSQRRWWLNDISLDPARSSAAASDIEDMLASVPHYLEIELRRLIIEDEFNRKSYEIENIFADIQHHDGATHLQLLADLPEILGGSLKVKSILQQSKGMVYFQAEQLNLDPVAEMFDLETEEFQQTEMAGEFWLRLRGHHIAGLDADITVAGAAYPRDTEETMLPYSLTLQFNADKYPHGWVLRNQVQNILVNKQAFPDIRSQLSVVRETGQKRLEGWLDSIDVPRFLNTGKDYLPAELVSLLDQSKVQAQLNNTWFSLPLEDLSQLKIMSRVSGLSNQPVNSIPGVSGLDADIFYTEKQLKLSISEQPLSLDFDDQFIAPLEFEQLSLNAYARFESDAVIFSVPDIRLANDDIKLAGRLWLETDPDSATPPFFYLRASFDEGAGSQKSKYLPIKILPESTRQWIDNSIHAVDISRGGLLFHGRLQDIKKLESDKAGELMVEFDINNTELTFNPNWKTIKQGKGRVVFHNMGFDINLDSAEYGDIKNARGNISLPNYSDSVINVDIDAGASSDIVLPAWLAMPVGAVFRDVAENLQGPGGRIDANIKLSLPLENNNLQQEVVVKLNLQNAAIRAPAWGVELSQINGEILVTRDRVSAVGIRAQYFKDPVTIDIDTDNENHLTLIKAAGLVETQQLLNLLPASIARGIDGRSDWEVNLAIANRLDIANQPVLAIDATSNLKGTAINLPEPYSKAADARRRVSGKILIQADDEISFEYSLGNRIRSSGFLLKNENAEYQLADLDIAFTSPVKPATENGIRIYGNLPKLPVDEWLTLFSLEASQQQPGSRSLLPLLQSIDIYTAQLDLFGRKFTNLDFFMRQSPRGFSGRIDSPALKGEFDFPKFNSAVNPAVIDLEYAKISSSADKSIGTGLLPNDLFNLRLRSKEFIYDNRVVTDLQLDTSVSDNKLLVDVLTFKRDTVDFKFDGHWLYDPVSKEHNSLLNAVITGDEFGQAIAKLDFGDTIHNGSINFQGQISWPDELLRPHWDILSGKGKFKLEDGVLKDIEPGTGRFVGLLSLSALPRRLALDFSDVLFKGMEFDEIKGDLVLDGQSLYTSNTRLDGPAAKVKVVGRTGLRDRDYDQKIYVVPKIRHALPVIGSILQGSGVGWGLLLLQNLFKSSIDESVEIEYGLTGSWDEPVIEVLNKPEPVKEENPSGTPKNDK